MKKKRIFSIQLTMICMLFLCSSCGSIKDDWQQAEQVDTIEKYQEFIKKHPHTDHAAAAFARIRFLQEEIQHSAQEKPKVEPYTKQFKDQKAQVNTWSWRASIQSNPPGAKVYCVSDPEDRIYLGQTPINVEILVMELRGTPGQIGSRSDTYKLPTRRIGEGFYCIFELVNGDVTKQVYAFDSSKLSEKATGGLAHDLRQGKYVLFKKGTLTIPQQIPQGYKFPAPLVNELNADFQQESRELASQQEQIPPDVAELIKKLQSENPSERSKAAVSLGDMGKRAVPAIPHLIRVMQKDNVHIEFPGPIRTAPHERAAEALGKIGDKSAVPALLAVIKTPVRSPVTYSFLTGFDYFPRACVAALAQIGDESTIPALFNAYSQSNWAPFTDEVATALCKMGEPAVSFLLSQLISGSKEKSNKSAFILLKIQEKKDFKKLIIPVIQNAISRGGYSCEHALYLPEWRRELRVPSLLPTFIQLLKDENSRIRESAAASCGVPGNQAAVGPLTDLLKADKEDWVRRDAATALGEIKNKSVVESLIAALNDSSSIVRRSVVDALGEIKDPKAVEPLIAALKDSDSSVRSSAADALGEIKDPKAVEPLIAALKDSESSVRSSAADALGEIKDPKAVEPLVVALNDSDLFVRGSAADALGKLKASQALDSLVAALKDRVPYVRSSAAEALKAITGNDFGNDSEKWQAWWEQNKAKYQKTNNK